MRATISRLAAVLILLFSPLLTSVATAAPDPERTAKNSVYVELLGAAGFYSLNYERNFSNVWSARIGAELFVLSAAADESAGEVAGNAHFLALPISLSYLGLGSGAHSFEIGAGVTLANLGASATSPFNDSKASASASATTFWAFAPIGYRYQPLGVGFLFRAGLTPLVTGTGFLLWPHIGLGASF